MSLATTKTTLPTILTTSQKRSTGVDARDVRKIVLRAKKSTIEFEQIISRGTRTFDRKDFLHGQRRPEDL